MNYKEREELERVRHTLEHHVPTVGKDLEGLETDSWGTSIL